MKYLFFSSKMSGAQDEARRARCRISTDAQQTSRSWRSSTPRYRRAARRCGSRIVLVVRHVLRLQHPQRPVLVQLLPLVRGLLHLLRLLLVLHLVDVRVFISLQPIVLVLQVDLLVVDLLQVHPYCRRRRRPLRLGLTSPHLLNVDDVLDAIHPLELQLVAVVELDNGDDHDDHKAAGKLHEAGHVVVHYAGHQRGGRCM
mmetsp:Transcript_14131/g.37437  ORF Transcript_14131/g.37437 Transcript_14131/m.37437 type:complete len:200 (+) Transcript_14131:127-726(+)